MAQLQTTAVTGSLTVTGQIIAQTLNVQQVTSSIVYSSGSNRFGNLVTDVQQFTGSLRVTGSGIHYIVGGSVGIGTVLPSYRVQIDAPVADWGLHVKGVSTANNSYGMFIDAGTSASDAAFMVRSADTTSNFLRILGNGNIGIGTATPAHKLHIEAGGLLINTGTGASSFRDIMIGGSLGWSNGESHGIETIYGGSVTPSTFTRIESYFDGTMANMYFRNFYNAGTSTNILMTIRANGNVGIGTTAPGYPLHVVGNIFSSTGVIATTFWTNDTIRKLSAGAAMNFRNSAGTVEMIISSSGEVGIGTTSPGAKLTVYVGSGAISGTNDALRLQVASYSDASRNTIAWHQDSSNLNLGRFGLEWNATSSRMNFVWRDVYNTAAGSTELMRLTGDGNLGIGTSTPSTPLHVQGGLAGTGGWNRTATLAATYPALIFNSNGSKWAGMAYDYSAAMRFWVNANNDDIFAGTQALSILNNGNIGINTSSPSYRLDVVGASRFGESSTIILSNDGTYGTGYGAVSFGGNTNGFNRIFGSTGTADGLFLSSATGRGIFFRTNGAATDRMSLTPSGSLLLGDTVTPTEVAWFGTAALGKNGTNKVIIGYLSSTTNGAVIGGHNSALNAWAELNINGTNIIFRSNESETMRLTSGGNLGIGTTAPSGKLDLYTNTNAGHLLVVQNPNTGTAQYSEIKVGYNSTRELRLGASYNFASAEWNQAWVYAVARHLALKTEATYDIKFYAGGTADSFERMRITNAGNVGIGVTTPAAKLQVSGSSNVLSVVGSGSLSTSSLFSVDGAFGRLFEVTDDLSNSLFSVNTIAGLPVIEAFADYSVNLGTYSAASGSTMRITGSSVGIGTTNPGTTLDVRGNIRAQSFTGSFSGSSAAPGATNNVIYNSSGVLAGSNNFVFNGTSVGIGTTVLSNRLDVVGGRTYLQTGNEIYTLGLSRSGVNAYYLGVSNVASPDLYFSNNAGTTRVTFTDAGNVGIGTTTPTYKLDVSAVAGAGMMLRGTGDLRYHVFSTSLTNWVGYELRSSNVDAFAGGMFRNNADNNRVSLYNKNAEAISLMDTGNVGIGTTTPAVTLQVNATSGGIVRVTRTSVGSGYAQLESDGTNGSLTVNNSLYVYAGGSARMFVSSSGNVGIGTTNPSLATLQVGSTSVNSNIAVLGSSTAGIELRTNSAGGVIASLSQFFGNEGALQLYDSTTLKVLFRASGSSYINSTTGNFGIGTTAPATLLDINGTTTIRGNLNFDTTRTITSNAVGTFLLTNPADAGIIELNAGTTSTYKTKINVYGRGNGNGITFTTRDTEKMRVADDGNVGIGTTIPYQILHINGNILLDGLANGYTQSATRGIGYGSNSGVVGVDGFSGMDIQSVNAPAPYNGNYSQNLRFFTHHHGSGTGGTPRMFIQYNGNVGIGTTAPLAKLHVSGTSGGVFEVDGVNAVNALYVSSSGDVGIGTTNPAGQLSGTRGLSIVNATAALGLSNGTNHWLNYLSSTTYRIWNNSVSEVVTILLNGNVGIGTTNPGHKLDVIGRMRIIDTANSPGIWYAGTGTDDVFVGLQGTTSTSAWGVYSSAGWKFTILNGGSVGIGTTAPGTTLDVIGNVRAQSFTGSLQGTASYATQALSASYAPGGASQWTTTGNNIYYTTGNVGIGTSTIARKLDIYGDGTLVRLQSPTANQFASVPSLNV